jgi:hypothetical protein
MLEGAENNDLSIRPFTIPASIRYNIVNPILAEKIITNQYPKLPSPCDW